MSKRREQRAAEQLQRVGTRWQSTSGAASRGRDGVVPIPTDSRPVPLTTTGKADAGANAATIVAEPDAAKPTSLSRHIDTEHDA